MNSEAEHLLLHTFPALAHARDGNDILAALALFVDFETRMRLIYLGADPAGSLVSATVVANWYCFDPDEADPLLHRTFPVNSCPLIEELATTQHDPIWFSETACERCKTCRFVEGAGRFIAIKLYGVTLPGRPYAWHAALLITWEKARPFSLKEQYLFATIWETLAVAVSNLRLRDDILAMNQELARVNRLKDEFLSTISHELRTPLTSIYTLSDVLLHDESLEPERRGDVQVIYKAGKHMLGMVNDLLDMASLRAGTLKIYPEPNAIGEIAEEGIRTMQPLAEQKGLQITSSFPRELPPVLAERKRLLQIMINLLSNAVKFSERGVISVTARQEAGSVVVTVSDEGIGIDPAYHEAIFDPFLRIDSVPARLNGGTGLGLSIARHLVELHSGRLWVDSQPGRGAAFSFTLRAVEGHHESAVH